MESIKSWPKVAIIALVGLALGVGAVALYKKSERTAEASALPNAARIDRVNGEVGLNRSLDSNSADTQTDTQWLSASQNTPISVGDRIYTKDKSDASVAFTGRNFARLDQNTSLDVLTLADQKTQVALRDGSALFDIGNVSSGDLFEVATPCGAVDLIEPGLYQIEINEDGNAIATALSGAAQVVGQSGSGRIDKGEVLSVPCGEPAAATLSRVDPGTAGQVVDHYYRYRYPRTYDGRYTSYYSYLDDPLYYEPSRRYVSYQYASDYIPGLDDLDYYGDWQQVADYGYGWHPRVDTGWAPYQEGYWTNDYPYGLTWVSSEPWGYAPYHYGRWSNVNNQWFWIPERARTVPVYSPALVAFVPLSSESIGWVALGPGDPYVPRYYDANWNPRYLSGTPVIQERVVNINVPGAVTVVNVRNFDRGIDRRIIEQVDARQFAQVRPVFDPLAVRNLREVALRAHGNERRISLPARATERLERPVVASAVPATPFRRDLAQRFQVRAVADNARNQRWQLRDNRQGANAPNQGNPSAPNIAAEQARERQMADLSRQAARGDRDARQQMRQLQQQQRQEQRQQRSQVEAQERAQRMAAQQAQGERVRNNVQNRRPDERAQPSGQQAPRGTRGNQMMVNPQLDRRARNIRRQEAPQAQPRDRQRPVAPPQRPQVNRAQPQVQRPPQAAPQPRVLREQRQQQRKHEAQPRPQMQQQPAPMRQQPQVQRQPQQMRQQVQPRPQQAQPQRQQQQKKNERRPPDNPAGAQPQGKKGRGHP